MKKFIKFVIWISLFWVGLSFSFESYPFIVVLSFTIWLNWTWDLLNK